jgi:uncharacterized protein YdcH (DUF465 family)
VGNVSGKQRPVLSYAPVSRRTEGMTKAIAEEHLVELQQHHRKLDVEVSRLERRTYLTPSEHQQMIDLKKEKLRAKDRIASLQRA